MTALVGSQWEVVSCHFLLKPSPFAGPFYATSGVYDALNDSGENFGFNCKVDDDFVAEPFPFGSDLLQ